MSNYRSSSLLTTVYEVIENVKYNRISHYLKANNILVPEQFGFRKGIFTENAAFKLTDYHENPLEFLNMLCRTKHLCYTDSVQNVKYCLKFPEPSVRT
jgi:hypothetical protein